MAKSDRLAIDIESANLLRQIAHELSAKTGERVTLSDTLRMLVKNYRESQSVLTSFGLGGSQ
jgi:signal transduction histidine kinase